MKHDLPEYYLNLVNQLVQPKTGIRLSRKVEGDMVFDNCFTGSELVNWFINYDNELTRSQAIQIAQELMDYNIIVDALLETDMFCDSEDEIYMFNITKCAKHLYVDKKKVLIMNE